VQNGGALGIFVRRYRPLGAGFPLFGQAELNGNYEHTNYTSPTANPADEHTNTYGLALTLYGGVVYTLNRRWQIETGFPSLLAISYSYTKQTQQFNSQPAESGSAHNFNFASSLTGNNAFTVGVRYFIGG